MALNIWLGERSQLIVKATHSGSSSTAPETMASGEDPALTSETSQLLQTQLNARTSDREVVSEELWAEVSHLALEDDGEDNNTEEVYVRGDVAHILEPKCESCMTYQSMAYTAMKAASSCSYQLADLAKLKPELEKVKKQLAESQMQIEESLQSEQVCRARAITAESIAALAKEQYTVLEKNYDALTKAVEEGKKHAQEANTWRVKYERTVEVSQKIQEKRKSEMEKFDKVLNLANSYCKEAKRLKAETAKLEKFLSDARTYIPIMMAVCRSTVTLPKSSIPPVLQAAMEKLDLDRLQKTFASELNAEVPGIISHSDDDDDDEGMSQEVERLMNQPSTVTAKRKKPSPVRAASPADLPRTPRRVARAAQPTRQPSVSKSVAEYIEAIPSAEEQAPPSPGLVEPDAKQLSDNEADDLVGLGAEAISPRSTAKRGGRGAAAKRGRAGMGRGGGGKQPSRPEVSDPLLFNKTYEEILASKLRRDDTSNQIPSTSATVQHMSIHGKKTKTIREQQEAQMKVSVKEKVAMMKKKEEDERTRHLNTNDESSAKMISKPLPEVIERIAKKSPRKPQAQGLSLAAQDLLLSASPSPASSVVGDDDQNDDMHHEVPPPDSAQMDKNALDEREGEFSLMDIGEGSGGVSGDSGPNGDENISTMEVEAAAAAETEKQSDITTKESNVESTEAGPLSTDDIANAVPSGLDNSCQRQEETSEAIEEPVNMVTAEEVLCTAGKGSPPPEKLPETDTIPQATTTSTQDVEQSAEASPNLQEIDESQLSVAKPRLNEDTRKAIGFGRRLSEDLKEKVTPPVSPVDVAVEKSIDEILPTTAAPDDQTAAPKVSSTAEDQEVRMKQEKKLAEQNVTRRTKESSEWTPAAVKEVSDSVVQKPDRVVKETSTGSDGVSVSDRELAIQLHAQLNSRPQRSRRESESSLSKLTTPQRTVSKQDPSKKPSKQKAMTTSDERPRSIHQSQPKQDPTPEPVPIDLFTDILAGARVEAAHEQDVVTKKRQTPKRVLPFRQEHPTIDYSSPKLAVESRKISGKHLATEDTPSSSSAISVPEKVTSVDSSAIDKGTTAKPIIPQSQPISEGPASATSGCEDAVAVTLTAVEKPVVEKGKSAEEPKAEQKLSSSQGTPRKVETPKKVLVATRRSVRTASVESKPKSPARKLVEAETTLKVSNVSEPHHPGNDETEVEKAGPSVSPQKRALKDTKVATAEVPKPSKPLRTRKPKPDVVQESTEDGPPSRVRTRTGPVAPAITSSVDDSDDEDRLCVVDEQISAEDKEASESSAVVKEAGTSADDTGDDDEEEEDRLVVHDGQEEEQRAEAAADKGDVSEAAGMDEEQGGKTKESMPVGDSKEEFVQRKSGSGCKLNSVNLKSCKLRSVGALGAAKRSVPDFKAGPAAMEKFSATLNKQLRKGGLVPKSTPSQPKVTEKKETPVRAKMTEKETSGRENRQKEPAAVSKEKESTSLKSPVAEKPQAASARKVKTMDVAPMNATKVVRSRKREADVSSEPVAAKRPAQAGTNPENALAGALLSEQNIEVIRKSLGDRLEEIRGLDPLTFVAVMLRASCSRSLPSGDMWTTVQLNFRNCDSSSIHNTREEKFIQNCRDLGCGPSTWALFASKLVVAIATSTPSAVHTSRYIRLLTRAISYSGECLSLEEKKESLRLVLTRIYLCDMSVAVKATTYVLLSPLYEMLDWMKDSDHPFSMLISIAVTVAQGDGKVLLWAWFQQFAEELPLRNVTAPSVRKVFDEITASIDEWADVRGREAKETPQTAEELELIRMAAACVSPANGVDVKLTPIINDLVMDCLKRIITAQAQANKVFNRFALFAAVVRDAIIFKKDNNVTYDIFALLRNVLLQIRDAISTMHKWKSNERPWVSVYKCALEDALLIISSLTKYKTLPALET
ncbi:unnamed protein product [Nippostrongylus brasiliensis]|uniref:SH3 domain-binding protein 5-like n=1 Tax=Nippostrongylus brasiliensis TaxID=27835 RepID=A0A0N4Y035_NIPBR|nr:unnamed protein product [Nippostrongylus brasiliensis]